MKSKCNRACIVQKFLLIPGLQSVTVDEHKYPQQLLQYRRPKSLGFETLLFLSTCRSFDPNLNLCHV